MGTSTRRWSLIGCLAVGLTACADTPRERLASAWSAADLEQFDAYVNHFSADSAPLVRGLVTTASRTKKAFEYLDSPYDLVPAGDVLSVEERDQLALITVKAKTRYTVRMVMQQGTWVIDGTSLAALWSPLEQQAGDG